MGVEAALLTETKLTTPCIFHGFFSHQTLNIRKGGCLTLAANQHHKRVKALGTYLVWTMVPLGYEQVHVINVYLEPRPTEAVTKRRQRIVQIVDDILKQHKEARIVVGGDINREMEALNKELLVRGFTQALEPGTPTHKLGNHLDQVWVKNLTVTNALVANVVDQVSDHNLVKVEVSAPNPSRKKVTFADQ